MKKSESIKSRINNDELVYLIKIDTIVTPPPHLPLLPYILLLNGILLLNKIIN